MQWICKISDCTGECARMALPTPAAITSVKGHIKEHTISRTQQDGAFRAINPMSKDRIIQEPISDSFVMTLKCVISFVPEIRIGQPLDDSVRFFVLESVPLISSYESF